MLQIAMGFRPSNVNCSLSFTHCFCIVFLLSVARLRRSAKEVGALLDDIRGGPAKPLTVTDLTATWKKSKEMRIPLNALIEVQRYMQGHPEYKDKFSEEAVKGRYLFLSLLLQPFLHFFSFLHAQLRRRPSAPASTTTSSARRRRIKPDQRSCMRICGLYRDARVVLKCTAKYQRDERETGEERKAISNRCVVE